ncbi:MAG TPA: DUF3341 domain-containing protein [Pelomicrobium sp.]|nr:DUF3341 domain-containing protein [Pelomicrobium sp.]
MTGQRGTIAMFDSAQALLAAARACREAGYRHIDAFTPFPVEGLAETLGAHDGRMPWLILIGTLVGGAIGYGVQWYSAVIDYPLNVGGRPPHSWPAFMLITFELAVLGGAVAGFFGMLALNGLPRLHHPVFEARCFELATRDRFFLLIEAGDPLYDASGARALLERQRPRAIEELPP